MKFIKTSENGDATSNYDVILDKKYTVKQFINYVLTEHPNDWGEIGISQSRPLWNDNPKGNYAKGNVHLFFPDDILNAIVYDVKASGGWSRMDYSLNIKEPKMKGYLAVRESSFYDCDENYYFEMPENATKEEIYKKAYDVILSNLSYYVEEYK